METHAQHSIKHCLDMIAPFEMSNQQKEDGRFQFYQFMVSLYREMYQQSPSSGAVIVRNPAAM